jgi:hypothetical protein
MPHVEGKEGTKMWRHIWITFNNHFLQAGDVLGDDDDGTSDDEECLPTQTKRRRKSKRKRPKKLNDDEIGSLDFFTDDDDISCDDEDNWSDGSDASACCECKDPAEKSKLIRFLFSVLQYFYLLRPALEQFVCVIVSKLILPAILPHLKGLFATRDDWQQGWKKLI